MCMRGRAGGVPGQHAHQVVPGHGHEHGHWVETDPKNCLQYTLKMILKSTSTEKGVHLQSTTKNT